jgi:hypothetical protein
MASASFRRLSYGAGAHVILLSQCAEWGTFSSMGSKNLAEEAVISEPVSVRWFPVPRENTGKFANFGLEIAKAPRLSEENSIAYQ